ncbi:MAG: YsnF/AvaK domain-containing protein [Caulobacteraceae bacterium]
MTVHPEEDDLVVPLAEEQATITKALVETGRVQVSTRVEESVAAIHETLRHEDVIVERVAIGRTVGETPAIRREGDTFIYPIVEEVLFIEKRLVLKEEIHVRYKVYNENVERTVNLRSVHADIVRITDPT